MPLEKIQVKNEDELRIHESLVISNIKGKTSIFAIFYITNFNNDFANR